MPQSTIEPSRLVRRPSRLVQAAPIVAVAAAAAVVPALLLAATAHAHVMVAPGIHVGVVGTAGVIATAAALAMSVAAARVHDGRCVLLGMAFSVMATLLLIHALATPGVLVEGGDGLMQLAGAVNLPAGAAILAASAIPAIRRPRNVEGLVVLQLVLVAALAAAGAVALLDAASIPGVPEPGSDAAMVVFAAGAVAFAVLGWRAARTYLLSRRISDLLVAVGAVWLIAAQYGLLRHQMMDAAWWLAHGLEVAGIGLIGIPAALDLRYGVASRPLVGDLRPSQLVANEEAFLGGRVRALMLRLEDKDPSTVDHTRRVAALAVQIGEVLGLPERKLRLLALGGLLHDIGKLSVPDHILNKPAALSEEEFAIVRRHPTSGRALLVELGGFAPLVLRLVECHHERLDARGYPEGRGAGSLELEVRILAVADVYDALTADRVYRRAWTPQQAVDLLADEARIAFDERCVSALRTVLTPTTDKRASHFRRSPPPSRPPRVEGHNPSGTSR